MEDEISILRELGLTKTEAKVYVSLVEEGESTASPIGKKAGIHRKNVYDSLDSLLRKGFVSVIIKNNKKYWEALPPKKIKDILKERELKVNQILLSLCDKQKVQSNDKKITYFEGEEGIKRFLEDIISTKKEILIFSGTSKGYSQMGFFIFPWFKRLNKEKINLKILFNYNSPQRNLIIKSVKKLKYKILPESFNSETQFFIYGNKTSILIWSPIPLCVLINNSQITKGFIQHFKLVWQMIKK